MKKPPPPSPALEAQLQELIRELRGRQRKFLGATAGYLNGRMFAAVTGQTVAVRIHPPERDALIEREGYLPFKVGRGDAPQFVALPPKLARDPAAVRRAVESAAERVQSLKAPKPLRKRKETVVSEAPLHSFRATPASIAALEKGAYFKKG